MENSLENKNGRSIFDFKKNKYKNIKCSNCDELGHILRFCDKPINSYGIVLYKLNKLTDQIEYLMICRKHTIGYIEFIRGNYKIDNLEYLTKMFNIMTLDELNNIKTCDFNYLWNKLWNYKHKFNTEFRKSKKKFCDLKNDKYSVNLNKLIQNSSSCYVSPEWEFPKGRKNLNEDILDTSIREFYEETNIKKDLYTLKLNNNKQHILFNEEYRAFNNKVYNLTYYLAEEKCHIDITTCLSFNKHQQNEISNIEFYTLNKKKKMIRPYYKEKKKLIANIDTYIHKHLLDK